MVSLWIPASKYRGTNWERSNILGCKERQKIPITVGTHWIMNKVMTVRKKIRLTTVFCSEISKYKKGEAFERGGGDHLWTACHFKLRKFIDWMRRDDYITHKEVAESCGVTGTGNKTETDWLLSIFWMKRNNKHSYLYLPFCRKTVLNWHGLCKLYHLPDSLWYMKKWF